jgi:hypothetical protein
MGEWRLARRWANMRTADQVVSIDNSLGDYPFDTARAGVISLPGELVLIPAAIPFTKRTL